MYIPVQHRPTYRRNIITKVVGPQRRTGKVAVSASKLDGILLAKTKGKERVDSVGTYIAEINGERHDGPVVIDSTEVGVFGTGQRPVGHKGTTDISVSSSLESQARNGISGIVPVAPFGLVAIFREKLLRLPVDLVVGHIVGSVSFPLRRQGSVTSNPF